MHTYCIKYQLSWPCIWHLCSFWWSWLGAGGFPHPRNRGWSLALALGWLVFQVCLPSVIHRTHIWRVWVCVCVCVCISLGEGPQLGALHRDSKGGHVRRTPPSFRVLRSGWRVVLSWGSPGQRTAACSREVLEEKFKGFVSLGSWWLTGSSRKAGPPEAFGLFPTGESDWCHVQFILEDVAVDKGFGICSAVHCQADDGVITLPGPRFCPV